MNNHSKNDQELIKILGTIKGYEPRLQPYDYNNPEDLIEATTIVTAEYFDMAHYWTTITIANEKFDESLETFFPAAYMKIAITGLRPGAKEKLLSKASSLFEQLDDTLDQIKDNAAEKCSAIWKVVFKQSNEEVLKHFFGEVIHVENMLELERILDEELYDIFIDCEYKHSTHDAAKEFATVMKRYILENEN